MSPTHRAAHGLDPWATLPTARADSDPRVKPVGSAVIGGGGGEKPTRSKNLSPPHPHAPILTPLLPRQLAGPRETVRGEQMGEGGFRLPLGPGFVYPPKLKRWVLRSFQKTHGMRRGGVSHLQIIMRLVSPHASQVSNRRNCRAAPSHVCIPAMRAVKLNELAIWGCLRHIGPSSPAHGPSMDPLAPV